MEKQAPSIFNDVIGPVMRGPSSSHVAGAARIGDLLRQMAEGDLKEVIVDFDVNGSLAESHEGHGTDMGFACGILGVPLTDPRVDRYEELVRESGIDLQYRILDYGAEHPNHYRICAQTGKGETIRMDAISTGGGMIEMVALEGCPVSVLGGFLRILLPAAGGGERDFRGHGGDGEAVPADRFSGAVHGHGGSGHLRCRRKDRGSSDGGRAKMCGGSSGKEMDAYGQIFHGAHSPDPFLSREGGAVQKCLRASGI